MSFSNVFFAFKMFFSDISFLIKISTFSASTISIWGSCFEGFILDLKIRIYKDMVTQKLDEENKGLMEWF